MPLRLDIKRRLTSRSDRVKCVDLHPTEPWMLCALYNGHVHVMNYENQQLVKDFEVCDLPVRCARFVARKNWVLTGSDDMQIRVFNYNTLEKVHSFEAHSDYVRGIAVHPTQPLILTSSDDMLIKLWNWEKMWANQRVFDGHTHYVMQIVFNPKDNNTFASASLDHTVKVWQLGSNVANFTLDGHEKGVNCVDYYHGGDKPYLISGADDRLVKIWDYQNKTCVQTLEGHSQNIAAVSFHPELPIVLTGSEDGTVRIWHSGTYRLETSLNYGFERVWTISCMRGTNNVALGYDEGSIIIKVGREEPAMSMDINGGKIIWAKHSEMQQVNLKALPEGTEIKDGERLPVAVKDMGACEIYPQTVAHNPNGRFVVVCGDGEYIIYTSMALRNKAFGSAQEFVWALESSEYAIRETSGTVKCFRNFKERKSFTPDYGAEGIFGGYLLGLKTSSGLTFYDWETLDLVRRIEVVPRNIFWNETGNLVCLATDECYFILRVDTGGIQTAIDAKQGLGEDGLEDAFEVLGEVNEQVKTGIWVGDCFIYTNSVNRINYYVGGEIVTISHLDRTMYLLGYVAKDNRLYLGDKELNVTSFSLLLSVLEYQTAIMRRDFETADRVLPTIPKEHRTRVAHFLDKQGFKQQALQVSTDPDHRFDLALQIGDLQTALELARESENPQKWSQLADVATNQNQFELVKECLGRANDFGGLLLLATSAETPMVSSTDSSISARVLLKHHPKYIKFGLFGGSPVTPASTITATSATASQSLVDKSTLKMFAVMQIQHFVQKLDDFQMVKSEEIWPPTSSPIPTKFLEIKMDGEFSVSNFQASTIEALKASDTQLTVRTWKRLVKFLDSKEKIEMIDFESQVSYELLLVMAKGDKNELYNCRMDENANDPVEHYNNVLCDLIGKIMLPPTIFDVKTIGDLDEIFKTFLQTKAITSALFNILGLVFTEFNEDDEKERLAKWISENITKMQIMTAPAFKPFYGVTLRSGILIMPVEPLTTYSDYSAPQKASILTLISHETSHYLARKYVNEYNFSSPFTKPKFGTTVPCKDVNIADKFLELGRAMEIQLFRCQPDWHSKHDLKKAAEVFMERVNKYTQVPLFTELELKNYNIEERKHPSVSFGADLLQEKIPEPYLD